MRKPRPPIRRIVLKGLPVMPFKPPSLLKIGQVNPLMRRLDHWMLRHLWIPAGILILTAVVSFAIQQIH
jgi:hypothetical protein